MQRGGFDLVASGDAGPNKLEELYENHAPIPRGQLPKRSRSPDLLGQFEDEDEPASSLRIQGSPSARLQHNAIKLPTNGRPPTNGPADRYAHKECSPVPSFGSDNEFTSADEDVHVDRTPSSSRKHASPAEEGVSGGRKRSKRFASSFDNAPFKVPAFAGAAEAPITRSRRRQRAITPLPAMEDAEFDWSLKS